LPRLSARVLAGLLLALLLAPGLAPIIAAAPAANSPALLLVKEHFSAKWYFYTDKVVVEYRGQNLTITSRLINKAINTTLVSHNSTHVVLKTQIRVGKHRFNITHIWRFSPVMPTVKLATVIEISDFVPPGQLKKAFQYIVVFPEAPSKHKAREEWKGKHFFFSTEDMRKTGVKHGHAQNGNTITVDVNLEGYGVTIDPTVGYTSGEYNETAYFTAGGGQRDWVSTSSSSVSEVFSIVNPLWNGTIKIVAAFKSVNWGHSDTYTFYVYNWNTGSYDQVYTVSKSTLYDKTSASWKGNLDTSQYLNATSGEITVKITISSDATPTNYYKAYADTWGAGVAAVSYTVYSEGNATYMYNISDIQSYKAPVAGRIPINLTNAVANASVQLDLTGKIPRGWGLVRFEDANGTVIPHWIETAYSSVWVKLPASGNYTIYAVVENGTADSVGDPSSVFMFYDGFETWSGWVIYDSDGDGLGGVSQSSNYAYRGTYSLYKYGDNDPDGGYKDMGVTLTRSTDANIVVEAWIYRANLNGGSYDRVGLIDASGNGYGFALGHSSTSGVDGAETLGVDVRSAYSFTYSSTSISSDPFGAWYHARLIIGESTVKAEAYSSGSLIGSKQVTDTTYSSFTRFYVFGGFDYYVDEVRVYLQGTSTSVAVGSIEYTAWTAVSFNTTGYQYDVYIPVGYELTYNSTDYSLSSYNSTHDKLSFTMPAGGAIFNFTAWNSLSIMTNATYYPYGKAINVTARLLDPYLNPIPSENVTVWLGARYKTPNATLVLRNVSLAGGDTIAPHLYDWNFDGVDDHIAGSGLSLDNTFSVAARFRSTTDLTTTLYRGLVRSGIYSIDGFHLFTGYYAERIDTYVHLDSKYKLSVNFLGEGMEWHEVTLVLNATHWIGYLDGNYYSTVTVNGSYVNNPDYVIGQSGLGDSYWQGLISYTYITNTPLTDTKISQAYSQHIVNASGLVLFLDPTFWNGTVYVDLSGNGNDGTPYGGVARVPANQSWLWLVKGLRQDGLVHLEWFPVGTLVRFKDPATGSVVREVFVGSNSEAVDIPPGNYDVEAIIPGQVGNYTSTKITTDSNGYASAVFTAVNYDAVIVIQAEHNSTYVGAANATVYATGVSTSVEWPADTLYLHSIGTAVTVEPVSWTAVYTVDGSPAPASLALASTIPSGWAGPITLNATVTVPGWGSFTHTRTVNVSLSLGVFTVNSTRGQNITGRWDPQARILTLTASNTTLTIAVPDTLGRPSLVRLDGAAVDTWSWDDAANILTIPVPSTLVEVAWLASSGGGGGGGGGIIGPAPGSAVGPLTGGRAPAVSIPVEVLGVIIAVFVLAAAAGNLRTSGLKPPSQKDLAKLRRRARKLWRSPDLRGLKKRARRLGG